jgi:NOL1/NOP2/sun family putative RNA methylase
MQPPVPAVFLARMARLLGDEFPAFAASYDAPPVTGLRVNTLKITPDDLVSRLPLDFQPVPWSSEAFVVPDVARPGKHPYHAAGLYYLQDPSALLPVILLDPQPGEVVLDLSAAPGGKATHIAARLAGDGALVANETVAKRAWELAGNIERWGARNVAVTMETPERLASRLGGVFDAVLVDAPCSGEGMFRKSAAARQDWSPALVQGCALRQAGILEAAAALVRPGGRLVYSTCTFAPEEDEGTVAAFLHTHPDFELASVDPLPRVSAGRPDWLPEAGRMSGLEKAVRLWPHVGPGEGHFAVRLHRVGSEGASPSRQRGRDKPSQGTTDLLRRWWEENLVTALPEHVILEGSYLYATPADLPDLSGLRTIHRGWWLGTLKTGRFEPSHALALAVTAAAAARSADLPPGGDAVRAYLHGEILDRLTCDDGWVLVTTDGFPLGWGKSVGGRLKNLYPKGLRWN